MNSLNFGQRTFLKHSLGLGSGYVLGMSRSDVRDLFLSCSVDIEKDPRFQGTGTSMGKLTSEFLKKAENAEVARFLTELCALPESSFYGATVTAAEFKAEVKSMVRELHLPPRENTQTELPFEPQHTGSLVAQAEHLVTHEIYVRIETLLRSNHQQQAVEEAFKLVREQLRLITGKEKATDVFGASGQSDKFYEEIFGIETPFKELDERVRDQCVGVAHLHLAIQNYRNVFSHTPYTELEERETLQYLVLASHASEMISEQLSLAVASEVREWVREKRMGYPSAGAFYREFENLRWAADFPDATRMKLEKVKRPVLELFIQAADFKTSYDTSNIWLMCFQLVAGAIDEFDLKRIEAKPTLDAYGHDQMAGWDDFIRSLNRHKRNPD